MKEEYSEGLTELKWLRLFDKLIFEAINKTDRQTEASEVTGKY